MKAQDWPKACELPAGEHRLCACRHSQQWPYCDDSQTDCATRCHPISLKKPRFVWMCLCDLSQQHPFCDGDGHIKSAQKKRNS